MERTIHRLSGWERLLRFGIVAGAAIFVRLCVSVAATPSAMPAYPGGFAARSTPYDRFPRPVTQVFESLDGNNKDFRRMRKLFKVCHAFRYVFSDAYVPATPAETTIRKAGDCKDKSLWLIAQLNDVSARYVIGKLKSRPATNHAWVLWNDGTRWWILDPAFQEHPIPADEVSSRSYIPLYSFGKGGAYRHVGQHSSAHEEGSGTNTLERSVHSSWRTCY